MKALLFALLLAISGCASGGSSVRVPGTGGEAELVETRAYIYVDNRSWIDVVIYLGNARLGFVGALTGKQFRTTMLGRQMDVSVRQFAGQTYPFGPVTLYPGDQLKVQIAVNMSMTQVWVERG